MFPICHVLIILVHLTFIIGISVGDDRSQVRSCADIDGMLQPDHTQTAFEICVFIHIGEHICGVQFFADHIDAADPSHAEEIELTEFGGSEIEVEDKILVFGNRFGADIESGRLSDLCKGVTIANEERTSIFLFAHGTFDHGLETREQVELNGLLQFVFVPIPERQIKDGPGGITVLR